MAPKRQSASPAVSTPSKPSPSATSSTSTAVIDTPSRTPKPASSQPQALPDIVSSACNRYADSTPQRVKLIDAFMAFLLLVGGLQFVYVCAVGNYPFNAFLSGFSATVGQFVLTASLRIQTNPDNQKQFGADFSDERAFADYVFGSLILHFFCVNFIN